jgi:hypothetical protein
VGGFDRPEVSVVLLAFCLISRCDMASAFIVIDQLRLARMSWVEKLAFKQEVVR